MVKLKISSRCSRERYTDCMKVVVVVVLFIYICVVDSAPKTARGQCWRVKHVRSCLPSSERKSCFSN